MLLKLDQFSSLNVNMSIVNFGRKIIKLIYARKAIQLRRLRQIEAQRVFYYLSFQNLGPQPSHFRLGHLITTLLAITRLLDFWVTTLPYPTRNWKATTRWGLSITPHWRKTAKGSLHSPTHILLWKIIVLICPGLLSSLPQYSPMKRGPCCWNSSWSMNAPLLTLFAQRLTITKNIWTILIHLLMFYMFSLLYFVITEGTKLIAFNVCAI